MPPTVPVKDRDKRIRLDLTEAEQQRLRVVAAQHGLSMSAFVRSLVLAAIEPENGKKSSKKV
jgi:plasmid stability protein